MVSVGEKLGILPQSNWDLGGSDGALVLTRTSIFTKRRNTMTLPITRADFNRYQAGDDLVQNIFPDLNADQREFLMSGATPEEWAGIFPPEDEDKED